MWARIGQILGQNRGRALLVGGAALLGLAVVAASQAATSGAVDLLKVRLGGDAAQTRIVLDLDRAATGKVVSDGAANRRVIILLNGVATQGAQGAGQGLVRSWLVDKASGGARLQMDLAADGRIVRRFLLPPADGVDHYRYVVDVGPLRPGETPRLQIAAGTAAATVSAPPLALKKVVVIDAGHGGHDPGAHGALGLEKDLNLAAAQALKARLERTGRYKVVMTRDSDVYVPLEARVRVAQDADADLFISLHSDSGPDARIQGASVYTLSDKASARAQKFVREDDWFMRANTSGDRDVTDILFDLTQRATKNRSATFADTLVGKIEGRAPLLRRTHRSAGFEVLLAPSVPAVLLEMGFISNPGDEARLRDPKARAALADAVAGSIDDYFAETTRLAAR